MPRGPADVVGKAMESKRLRRYGRALEWFLRAIAQNPREAQLFVEVADVQLSRGELEAAARAAESAIRLTPSTRLVGRRRRPVSRVRRAGLERAYVLNGHALLGLRRWSQAKAALERGLRHNPTSTTLAAMLATAKKHDGAGGPMPRRRAYCIAPSGLNRQRPHQLAQLGRRSASGGALGPRRWKTTSWKTFGRATFASCSRARWERPPCRRYGDARPTLTAAGGRGAPQVGDEGAPIPACLSLPPALPVSRHQLEALYSAEGESTGPSNNATAQGASPSVYDQEVMRVVGIAGACGARGQSLLLPGGDDGRGRAAVRMLDTIEPEAEGRTTVIFDVDDTALSSQRAMAQQRHTHVMKVSQGWCARQEGRQIPQVRVLPDPLTRRGGRGGGVVIRPLMPAIAGAVAIPLRKASRILLRVPLGPWRGRATRDHVRADPPATHTPCWR